MISVPDVIKTYLDEVSLCINNGNACVMVGAGFSFNAKPNNPRAKPFPTWQDLGKVFYGKVRGNNIEDSGYNFYDPLRLAYEVETNFGKHVLNNILKSEIPDQEYQPSKLHVELLKLPWKDVFTTNYDTLLERAATEVIETNYSVVVNHFDLVHSLSPRIIKLHGCFNASTPLIISQEDYRSYPKKFAPFVNTVQQALIENTLCLIGFSGDDPNFLNWIGWVRDNLGKDNIPKMYLIGAMNLTASQISTLSEYNIRCVDMSLCNRAEKISHYDALKTFVEYCQDKININKTNDWYINEDLSIPNTSHSQNEQTKEEITREIIVITEQWRNERESCPNWIILPLKYRGILYRSTKNWIVHVATKHKLDETAYLTFLKEYLWRKSKCLNPVWDNEIEFITAVLFSTVNSKNKEIINLSVEIAIHALRYFREEGKKIEWKQLYEMYLPIAQKTEFKDSFNFENCMCLLFDLKKSELQSFLMNWDINDSSEYWMYKKASLLAESGMLQDGKDLLETALMKVRKKINLRPRNFDLSYLSLESYILVLLPFVIRALEYSQQNYAYKISDEFKDRLSYLKRYECDPWLDMQLLEERISGDFKRSDSPQSDHTATGFDIGVRSNSTTFKTGVDKEIIDSFAVFKFYEDASIPFRLHNITMGRESVKNAIARISDNAPHWSLISMIRANDTKTAEIIFNRSSLSKFNVKYVDSLVERYIELLREFIADDKTLYPYGFVLPEVLSRLCCKCSVTAKQSILKLLTDLYEHESNKNNSVNQRFQNVDNLMHRLLVSMGKTELSDNLADFFNISCINIKAINKLNDNPIPHSSSLDPVSLIAESIGLEALPTLKNFKPAANKIMELTAFTGHENKVLRQSSCRVLFHLAEAGILNKNQFRDLKKNVFKQLDEFSIPKNTSFYSFGLVKLFNDVEGIKESFKSYLLGSNHQVQSDQEQPNSFGITGRHDSLCYEIAQSNGLVNWTPQELKQMTVKLIDWWDRDKKFLTSHKDYRDITIEMRRRFRRFTSAIQVLVVSHNQENFSSKLLEIISDYQAASLPRCYLMAISMQLVKVNPKDLKIEIEYGLASKDRLFVIDSFDAMLYIAKTQENLPTEYVNLVEGFLRFERSELLANAFYFVIKLIEFNAETYIKAFREPVLFAINKVASTPDIFSQSTFLELKFKSAHIASYLYKYFLTENLQIPDVIEHWKKICSDENEFNEVKSQWSAI